MVKRLGVFSSAALSGALILLAATSPDLKAANPVAISLDFVGTGGAWRDGECGRGRQGHWNSATGASRSSSPLALVDETGAATSATATWTSDNTWSTAITNTAGNLRMMKGYLDTGDATTSTVTIAGLVAAAYDIYVYVDGDNGGGTRAASYQISGAGITTSTVTLTDAANTNFSGSFTQASNSAGNYVKFSINGTGFTITATPGTSTDVNKRAPVNGLQIIPTAPATPDFTLAATPASQSLLAGGMTTYTVNVAAVGGFGGVVNLGVTGLPAAATTLWSANPVTGTGSVTLTVTTAASTPVGSSALTITGTSAALTHSAGVTLVVSPPPPPADFQVAASPASQSTSPGGMATYAVSVTGLNGFGSSVTLSATGLPAGAAAQFTPGAVTGTGSATLQITTTAATPVATSTVTITGTSGALVHSTTVALSVTTRRAISLDFVGTGTAMAATESAGVVAKTNWNSATGASRSGSPLALVDETARRPPPPRPGPPTTPGRRPSPTRPAISG